MNNDTFITFEKAVEKMEKAASQKLRSEAQKLFATPVVKLSESYRSPRFPVLSSSAALPEDIQKAMVKLQERINKDLLIESKRIFEVGDGVQWPPDCLRDMLHFGVGVMHVQRKKPVSA